MVLAYVQTKLDFERLLRDNIILHRELEDVKKRVPGVLELAMVVKDRERLKHI